jgi:PIN domain nuclease of toxin-antitoxin system
MYLLDTHAFLWFIWNDPQLSVRAKEQIEKTPNCYVSMSSLWEISIKLSLNKLAFPSPYQQYIPQQLGINGFRILPIRFKHTVRQNLLPRHHGDPFDRMLISQSLEEGLTLISKDAKLAPYGVTLLW